MGEPARKALTYADYLAIVADETEKIEFVDGQLYAMAGGSIEHARLTVELSSTLHAALKGRPCRVFSPDLRVRYGDRSFYPDVTVVCGPPLTHPDDAMGVTNPTVLVEVLSPSTESRDRGQKFYQYLQIESLQHYVMVHPESRRVDHYRRKSDGQWSFEFLDADQVLQLDAIACDVSLTALFGEASAA